LTRLPKYAIIYIELEEKMNRPADIHWLSDEEYAKAVSQYKLQLNGIMDIFNIYGMGTFIPGAIFEITKLTEDFGLRVRGVDKPISLERVRKNHK
jgi:hypothetical protein